MRKHGIDLKEISARLETMSPDERAKVWASYRSWIAKGAKVQGWQGSVGAMILGASLFALLITAINQMGTPLLYGTPVLAAGFGVFLFCKGARREREWREANPFDY